jgi:NADPH-dependent 2,4-dienoyl-CoA reductase/sulfur reductase-like enzyme
VDVLLGATVERLVGDGRVEELVLAGGRRVPCDVLVVGIGVAPELDWVKGSGLPVDGIPVDGGGRSALPGVYAAGDAARPFCPELGVHVRSEHWEAAARQGAAAARAMLGLPGAPVAPTSFWSDQYGVRIQFLGQAEGADRVEVDGELDARDFAAVWLRGDRPVAALLVGRPSALAEMRRRLTMSPKPDPAPSTKLEAA